MPLDPQAQAILDAGGVPVVHELSPEEARIACEAIVDALGEPPPLPGVEDRSIPAPHGDIAVRVYTPEGSEPFPALVYFHGGGWVVGSIAQLDITCRHLAIYSGCKILSVDYRLAPEHKYPAAPEDCYAATKWIAEHAVEFGIDAGRLAVGGDSAGGNLAAVVALMARDRGGPPLAFQLLVYPVTDMDFETQSYREYGGTGEVLPRATMEYFWGHYLNDPSEASEPYASPLRAPDLAGLPPALVITAEVDVLRDEGEAYARRLQDAGVPTTLSRYDGMFHAFFQLPSLLDKGMDAVREAGAALREALGTSAAAR